MTASTSDDENFEWIENCDEYNESNEKLYSSECSITEGEDDPYHESPYCSDDDKEYVES
jgi:hypothetical protein